MGADVRHPDRVGRAEREHRDPVGALGQLAADGVDLGAHLERGRVDVAVPVDGINVEEIADGLTMEEIDDILFAYLDDEYFDEFDIDEFDGLASSLYDISNF